MSRSGPKPGPSGRDHGIADDAVRDLNARLREEQVIALRLRGATFEAIAADVGYANHSAARKAWKRALARIPKQSIDEARHEMAYELSELKAAIAAMAHGDPRADDAKERKPNLFAVDRVLSIMERQAKLMGLDARPEEAGAVNVTRRYVGVVVEEV